jgi:hypothetical protein
MFPRKPASILLGYDAGSWARGTIMMSVRILGALGLALGAMTGGALASSFVVLGAPTSTPSIVALGEPVPNVAYEDVTYEKVAAIPSQPEPKRDFMQSPMVIRGGIVGDVFATPTPRAAPAATTAAAAPVAGAKTDKKITATNSPLEPATPQPAPIPGVEPAE